jgi:hypothetical protein
MGFLEPIKMPLCFFELIRMHYLVLLEPLRSHLLGLHSSTLELTGLEGMNLQGYQISLDRMKHYGYSAQTRTGIGHLRNPQELN